MLTVSKNARSLACSCLISAAAIICSAGAVTASSDIADHWAESDITPWISKGIIVGYPDGTFKPDSPVTRAEFMAIVNKAYGLTGTSVASYSDVRLDSWYADVIGVAVDAGYINGYPDGSMRPDAPISRYEAAVIIAKVNKIAPASSSASAFSDVAAMPLWAKQAVGAVYQKKIVSGYPDGSFGGNSYITRAESVVSLTRGVAANQGNLVFDKPGIYGTAVVEHINGNVTITSPSVTLRNKIIDGNLTIGKEVGDGPVNLETVIVKGISNVEGGGANSIQLNNCRMEKIIVSGENGTLHMKVSGASDINWVTVKSDFKLTETELDHSGVENLDISAVASVSLSAASLDNIQMKANGSKLMMDSHSTIEKMTGSAPDCFVYMEQYSRINMLAANQSIRFDGTGTVGRAEINASGVRFRIMPDTVIIKPGIAAPTYHRAYIESFKPADGDAKVPLNSNIVISFSETVRMTEGTALDNKNVDYLISLTMSRPDGPRVFFDATRSVSNDKTVITVNPSEDLNPDLLYCLSVDGLEGYNNEPITGNREISFRTVSMSAPRIVSISPADGTTDVPADAEIVITLSDIVRKPDNTVLNSNNVVSHIVFKEGDANGPDVEFDAAVDSIRGQSVIKVLSTYYLDYDKKYYVALHGLENEADQAIDGSTEATFVTMAERMPPIIHSFQPANWESSVPVDQDIVITFNNIVRMINGTALTDENIDDLITLKTPSVLGEDVVFDATVRVSGDRTVVTVQPTANLTGGQSYYVAVKGLEDSYNQELTGIQSAVFTTAAATVD